jgi:flagellin
MVVKHNLTALNANRQLKISTRAQAKSTEKLSSGFRINRAGDDAAGLSISEKMRSQIRGLTQASRNAQDGISLAQTAEGALGEVTEMLQRMNELATQAQSGTLAAEDAASIQAEVDALVTEIDRVKDATTFNNKKLLDGSMDGSDAGKTTNILVGATGDTFNKIQIKIGDMSAATLIGKKADGTTDSGAWADDTGKFDITHADALETIQGALAKVSSQRSDIGAVQNRLEHTINNLDNVIENTTSAESQIRDTNMAEEMLKYSNNSILMQAGQSMLAQANQSNQGVLSLLG